MTEDEDKKEDIKKFGIGKIFLESIQELLHKANYSSQYGDYSGWRNCLDCIVRKCVGRLSAQEKDDMKNKIDEIDKLSIKYTTRCNKDQRNANSTTSKQTIILGKKYAATLSEYEILIVKILDRLGWLIPSDKKPKRPQ